ncbi:hypothetical protein N0V88_003846 [Collariella sp. IMI 366227]|nr:hypothetical protein N0V88_003846 [Collariella sp. IMI 366227]
MGIHPECAGSDSALLLVREVAMMLVMDRLTDKPDWHVKIYDETIVDKWRQEALAWPEEDLWDRIANVDEYWHESEGDPKMPGNILNKDAVNYCILELRHKAEHFKLTGVIPTLEATHGMAKSDTLVSSELHSALHEAFVQLKADQASKPDWHPNTKKTVQNLVHPSMYPLVYGRSRFLPKELVGVDDAIDKWAGKGDVIPRHPDADKGIDYSYWSGTYQWLPANVKFTDNGGVEFTSYINGLHPTKHRRIYSTIERLIQTALPAWDQCLKQREGWGEVLGPGRGGPRIVPENPEDPPTPKEMLVREATALRASGGEDEKVKAIEATIARYDPMNYEDVEEFEERWRNMRSPVQPVMPRFNPSDVCYKVTRRLQKQFKDTGLQIIVKMASIELTPEKPEFSPGGWHVEGQMNEHIVATALYYLDSENITDSHLEFRTCTSSDLSVDLEISQDGYHWMQSMYGTALGIGMDAPCLQNYGSVMTRQGRLLAFPNVFQHRVSGFRLADPTKPGHRRFIALWLVDPVTRIISTANVPPQQAEWWVEGAFGALAGKKKGEDDAPSDLPPETAQLLLDKEIGGNNAQIAEALAKASASGKGRLPPVLLNMAQKQIDDAWVPMTREEAEGHRFRLMEERSRFQGKVRETWQQYTYNFCEH